MPTAKGDPGRLTEAAFQRQVTDLAKLYGWRFVHFRAAVTRSGKWATPIQGDPGFPDLVLVHPRRGLVVFAELKRQGGRTTAAQRAWLADLRQVGVAYEWRPSDWPEIVAVLTGGQGQ